MQKTAFCYRQPVVSLFTKQRAASNLTKTLLVMKLTAFLLLIAVLQVSAGTKAQTVTYTAKSASLQKVFAVVRQQTGFLFFYDPAMLRDSKPVTISAENLPLESFIRSVLKDQPLTYTIENKTVFISRKPAPAIPEAEKLLSPPSFVTGRVVNAGGEPLQGATITVKRTRTGTNTDVNGIYLLKYVEPNDTLVFSFIGYKTSLQAVGGRSVLNVKMEEAKSGLDEVVIQAYGRTTQRLTTGNIARVTAEEIAKQPVMDPLLALQGRVAGLVVTPQTGYQGGPVKIEIRGRNAINTDFTSDPLYIIDGVPLTVLDVNGTEYSFSGGSYSRGLDLMELSRSGGQSPLFGINPSDIESFEILKDADATAIYGSRGANGVILITTKRGHAGKNNLSLDLSTGVNVITRYWDLLNTEQYLTMRKEAFKNDGIIPTAVNAPDLKLWDSTRYTNWQKVAYGGTGRWINAQSALSGGNAQTIYRVSAGYNRATDITTVSGATQRLSLATSLTTRSLNQRFSLTFSGSYSFSEITQISIPSLSVLPPNAPPLFDSSGAINFKEYRGAGISNPVAGLFNPYTGKTRALNSAMNISYTIAKGFVAKVNLGYNNSQNDQSSFIYISSQDPEPPPSSPKPTGSATFGYNFASNLSVEPLLEYSRLLGKGSLNVLVGGTAQSSITKGHSIRGTNYTSDVFLQTITAAPNIVAEDAYGEYKYTGVFARLGYNWENKYILNLNARRDGSSRFGEANRFGNFGSAGVAWIVSDEEWMKKALPSFITLIKLRGSIGVTGSDGVGDYKYLSQFGNAAPVLTSYNGITPLTPQILENPDFHWQENKKLEGALDLGFFQDRLSLEVAYYRNRCNNQLVQFPIPAFSGFTTVVLNSPANVQNSGWEFLMSAGILRGKKLEWSANFNLGMNENKLLSYPLFEESPYYTTLKIGGSLNDIYVFHYEGVDPKTGEYMYTDHNNDGIVASNGSVPKGTGTDDMYYRLNRAPKFTGGMGHQLRYKSLQLTAFFSFTKQIARSAISATHAGNMGNISTYQFENRWHEPDQIAIFSRFSTLQVQNNLRFTDASGQYTDASFIRLRTLALSYTIPQALVKKMKMNNLSFNLNAQNIFVLTKYKGLDPEMQSFGSMPPTRTITLGISASF